MPNNYNPGRHKIIVSQKHWKWKQIFQPTHWYCVPWDDDPLKLHHNFRKEHREAKH